MDINDIDKDIPASGRTYLTQKIDEHWKEIIDSLIEAAKGMWVMDFKKDNTGRDVDVKIYQKPPDKEVAFYLANQKIGKPGEGIMEEEKVNFILD